MHTYKRTIISGNVLEVEYYQSIRKRNKKNVTRGSRRGLSSEKQSLANKYNGIKRTQRMILNNFKPGDWWVKFGFKDDVDEEQAKRLISNFLKRYARYLKKQGKEFKYIGCAETGSENGGWHLHLVIEKSDLDDLKKIWGYGGVWVTPLYQEGYYYDLAKYVRKNVGGKKRLMQSRNLTAPFEDVKEIGKRELRRLEKGLMIKIPEGYRLIEDDFSLNEFTDARYTFTFIKSNRNKN